jgi:RNA polymerase sigma-B factor
MAQQLSIARDPEELVARFLENPRSDLKDLIMVQYSGLVERVARRFTGLEPLDDLVQVGYIGLLNALSKFDPSAGVRFNTYATYLVAGEIKHYLRDRSQTIRQPAWLQELRQKINKSQVILQGNLGRTPTNRDIAEMLGVPESSVEEVYAANELLKVGSLDATTQGDEDGATEVERLDAADFCPEQLGLEDRLLLEHAMQELRDLERQVLILFHFEGLNQTEIAARLEISCNYVSHILRQSLLKLRKVLTSEDHQDRVLRRQSSSIGFEVLDEEMGVYTEDYFRNRLAEEVHRAASDDSSVALVLIEFVGLDTLAKFYGAQSVVDFMADAAEFFRESFRRLDVVARHGQTGFAVILPSTRTNVSIVRQRLVQITANWTRARMLPSGNISARVGTACSPDDGRTAIELIASAAPMPLEKAA